jgi:hypothetical protein
MAKFVATNVVTTLNGTDISTNLNQVELALSADEVETTAFGTSGYRSYTGGLKQGSLTLAFHQDFGAGGIDSLLYPLLGTNPSYSFEVLVSQYSPVASSVGDLASFSVTLPVNGAVTRATA